MKNVLTVALVLVIAVTLEVVIMHALDVPVKQVSASTDKCVRFVIKGQRVVCSPELENGKYTIEYVK